MTAPPADVAEPDLTLLVTSPRVAPGLLTRTAWQALDGADVRAVRSTSTDPQPAALAEAGVTVSAGDAVGPAATGAGAGRRRAATAPVVWVGSRTATPG